MAVKVKQRGKNKDNAKRAKKKISILIQERVEYVDYKDVNLLRRFMSDRAKIRARRVTGNDQQQQRAIAIAIKNAREMALLPYASRVTTQRSSRDRGDRGDRGRPPRNEEADLEATEAAPAEAAEGEATEEEDE
jgi:small subunit ribosomal protein S18